MLVKNLTPYFHGAILTSRRPPQPEMSLAVRGTFRIVDGGVVTAIEGLDQGFMSGELFAEDDPERLGALRYPGDFADLKLRAEVFLQGTCRPPGGKPVPRATCGMSVGAWRKELAVFGDRTWDVGLGGDKASEPKPFTEMPLTWERAFGGPGHAPNPVGRGQEGARLPNVEYPSDLVRSRGQKPPPASFGAVSPHWEPRKSKVGKNYGAAWLKTRAPYAPDDLDWSWFHAAPQDQQLDGYLRGDEDVVFTHLVRDQPTVRTKLPALRLRVFVKDETGSIREVPMVLDTLYADTDDGTVRLTWRGLTPVRETDFEDVKIVFIASEPLASAPRPAAEYEAALLAFEKDPTGVLAALPDGLIEAGEREAKRRRGEAVPPPADLPPGLDPITRETKSRLGKLMSDEDVAASRANVAKVMGSTPAGTPPIDLEKAVADASAAERKNPPPARVIKPGRMPDLRLRAQMRGVLAEVTRLRALEKQADRKLEGVDEMEAIPLDPRWKQLDPDYEVPGPLSTDAPGPGADLRDRDFAEHDLSGADLTGADLRRANFAHALLRGTKLAGAKLGWTILYGADLTGADLSGADLTLANAGLAKLDDANLRKAKLTEAFFEGATFARADLSEIEADYAVLSEADLRGTNLRKARLDHADLAKAKLGGAHMQEISAERALFSECSGPKAQLGGASLPQASFQGADLTGATFVGARAPKAFFERAKLDQADFAYASLPGAHLTQAHAFRARFHGADLKDARCYRADLAHADMTRANLHGADLRKAHIEGTRFNEANLFEAKLLGARGGSYDVKDANLKRSVWDER
jgi:uncharacterized protein YjbI with pentapeptide repeats